jgi:hypothetical protein
VGSGRAAAKRPVRGRVQGPGRGAAGEVVPTPVSCPGAAGQRDASAFNGVGEVTLGDRSWAAVALGESAPVSLPVSGSGLAGSVAQGSGSSQRGVAVFTPRKFQAKQIARIGGDLWGYLVGGREQADYYLDEDGTPSEATAELHGRLWARLGLERLDRATFGRLAAGCHPLTGERLVKTSHVTRRLSRAL